MDYTRWDLIAAKDREIEDLTEALQKIADWALRAYPVEMFADQDLGKARIILETHGIDYSAMHGQWARHLLGGIGEIAKEAIKT